MSGERSPRRARFRFPLRTWSRIAREIDDELAFHLAMREEEYRSAGLPPDEAQRRAMARFGDIAGAKGYMRDVGTRRAAMGRARDATRGWGQDLTHAMRAIARAPGFFSAAAFILALAIGATTAVYSVAHHLILNPVPAPDADRMVALYRFDKTGHFRIPPDARLIDTWRTRVSAFERLETYSSEEVTLRIGDEVESAPSRSVSPGMLSVFGVHPSLGRGFLPDEGQPGAARVAMLSWSFWQSRFGGAADVIGRSLFVDNQAVTVVGVMPPGMNLDFFDDQTGTALWFAHIPPPNGDDIFALGILRPGTLAADVDRALTAVQRGIDSTSGRYNDFVPRALPIPRLIDEELSKSVVLVASCALVVLLIACANISSLLLARATVRRRELAVRMALGAGRWRIVRYLVLESLLLAVAAGLLGVGAAVVALRLLARLHPGNLAMLETVNLHPTTLLVALAAALGSAMLFGIIPALTATPPRFHDALLASGRGASASRGTRRFRTALVGAQFAASTVLLVTAFLLLRSMARLQDVSLGYDPQGLVSVVVEIPKTRSTSDTTPMNALQAVADRVREVPGVRAATVASGTPLHNSILRGRLFIEGKAPPAESEERFFAFTSVGPDFFRLTGMPLRRGRVPAPDSTANEVVIDETTARHMWPDEDPIGRRFRMYKSSPWKTVVGLVGDVNRPGSTFGNGEHFYFPIGGSDERLRIVARVEGDPSAALSRIAAAVLAFDPFIKLRSPSSEVTEIERLLARPRFLASLFGAFAGVALVLAAVGLYGVLAYGVGQRRREIGVRMALGADAARVAWLVVGDAMRVVVIGLALGIAGSLAAGRFVSTLLYDIPSHDAPSLAGAVAALSLIALLAAWLPARRAARIDPMEAVAAE